MDRNQTRLKPGIRIENEDIELRSYNLLSVLKPGIRIENEDIELRSYNLRATRPIW